MSTFPIPVVFFDLGATLGTPVLSPPPAQRAVDELIGLDRSEPISAATGPAGARAAR